MINMRLGEHHSMKQEALRIIETAKKYPGSCDIVWFSSEYGYPTLEKHKRNANKIAEAAKLFRENNIKVSLQISNTIGHGEYMKSCDNQGIEQYSLEKMVGHNGIKCEYAFCWNGKNFRKYIIEFVKLYAEVHPDTVWIDDDMRINNHYPVRVGCFCDNCMKRFNEKYGSCFSREELVKNVNINSDDWRGKWIDFSRQGISELAGIITDTVLSVSAESRMAYQYGFLSNSFGRDVNHVFHALNKGKRPPASRAGAGAYNDKNPYDLVKKQINLSFANSKLPVYVNYRVPEIENIPDVIYGKSNYGTILEAGIALAYGHTGLSLAAIMSPYEDFEFFDDLFKRLSQNRSYWEIMISINRHSHAAFLGLAPTDFTFNIDDGCNFEYGRVPNISGTTLTKIGFAESFESAFAPAIVLTSEMCDYISDSQITELFCKPVITDGSAIAKLINRGFAKYLPIHTEKIDALSYSEIIPGDIAWTQTFFSAHPCRPHIIKGECEPLGRLINPVTGEDFGISAGIVDIGKAKWAVFAYCLFEELVSGSKRRQIIKGLQKITSLPAYIKTPAQVTVMPRVNDHNELLAVSVLNISISPTDDLKLLISRPAGSKFYFANAKKQYELTPIQKGDKYEITIPGFDKGWDIATVFLGQ